MDDVHGALVDQRLEPVEQEDVLPRLGRRGRRVGDVLPVVHVHPGDQVLHVGERILLHAPGELDRLVLVEMTGMVDAKLDLVADVLAHHRHELLHQIESLLRDLDAGERVVDLPVVTTLTGVLRAKLPLSNRSPRMRVDQDPFTARARDQLDSEVHLERRVARVHAGLLHAPAEGVRVGRRGGIGVEADPVPVLAAQHLIHGDVVGLAGQVPQGGLHPGDAAALAAVVAELLDDSEDLLDVARVLAKDAALQHQGVLLGAVVAHLAVAPEALVRVDPDDRAPERDTADLGDAQVGDAEVGRARAPLDVLREELDHRLGTRRRQHSEAEPCQPCSLEEVPAPVALVPVVGRVHGQLQHRSRSWDVMKRIVGNVIHHQARHGRQNGVVRALPEARAGARLGELPSWHVTALRSKSASEAVRCTPPT